MASNAQAKGEAFGEHTRTTASREGNTVSATSFACSTGGGQPHHESTAYRDARASQGEPGAERRRLRAGRRQEAP